MDRLPEFDDLPAVLYPNRWKQVATLLLCAVLMVMGAVIFHNGARIGLLFLLLPGLGGVIIVARLHPRFSYLRLEPNSFIIGSLFHAHKKRWEDIGSFGVFERKRFMHPTYRVVAWNYASNFPGKSKLRPLNRFLIGYDAGFTDTYGLKAHELAEMMQRLRDEAVRRSQPIR
jgi:hypothetical protein